MFHKPGTPKNIPVEINTSLEMFLWMIDELVQHIYEDSNIYLKEKEPSAAQITNEEKLCYIMVILIMAS